MSKEDVRRVIIEVLESDAPVCIAENMARDNDIGMYFDTDDIADGRLSPVQRKQIAAMCKERSEKKDNILLRRKNNEN